MTIDLDAAGWPELEQTLMRLLRQRCRFDVLLPTMDYLIRDLNPTLDPIERYQLVRNLISSYRE